jgi:hypothetical protein
VQSLVAKILFKNIYIVLGSPEETKYSEVDFTAHNTKLQDCTWTGFVHDSDLKDIIRRTNV